MMKEYLLHIAKTAGFENFEIVDYIESGIFVIGLDETFHFVNKPLLKKLNLPSDELKKRSFLEFVVPDEREYIRSIFRALIAGEKISPFLVRYCLGQFSGIIEVNAQLLKGEKGVVGVIGMLSPAKGKQKEIDCVSFLELLPLPVAIFSNDGSLEYVNAKFVDFFGYTLEEMNAFDKWFVNADTDVAERKHLPQKCEGSIVHFPPRTMAQKILDVRCKDGNRRKVVMSVIPADSGKFFLIANEYQREIESKEKILEKFYNTQRNETFSVLAGMFAHDFNNILAGIVGNISLLKRVCGHKQCRVSDEASSIIADIEIFTKQGIALANNLLSMVKGKELEKTVFDVNELVRESATVFGRLHENIRIFFELSDARCTIFASRAMVEQMLFNLYINAHHAMPEGGLLHLATAIVDLNENAFQKENIAPGNYVVLSVRDTGCGMDEDTVNRIFEPFFSTKSDEMSFGLGLTSVKEIVQKNGGTIVVESTPGVGTRFIIAFPFVRE
ncbi:MAG: ATP-binding protein [Spirochaetes bacterium]|nr:ATP-binding protein [Spirochaetota bacterium]